MAARGADKMGAQVASLSSVQDVSREVLSTATVQIEMEAAARNVTHHALRSVLQSPGFINGVKELVREAALECAKEILAEDMGDLEERVRRIVAEQWETHVEAAAHQVLAEAISSIKRRLQGP